MVLDLRFSGLSKGLSDLFFGFGCVEPDSSQNQTLSSFLPVSWSWSCSPPPLCGATSASGDYVAKQGDKVAARVKAVDGDEQWILAEVVSYNHSTNK